MREQLAVGVDHDGVTDDLEHRQIGLRVRVGVALGQIDPLALGELPNRLGLLAAVDEQALGLAGVHPVDDARRTATRSPPSNASTWASICASSPRRRGDDVDPPARVLVLVGDLEHLRVEPRQHPGEDVGPEALEVARPAFRPASAEMRSRSAWVSASVEPRSRNRRFATASATSCRRLISPRR